MMETVLYDGYEKRLRVIVWIQTMPDGGIEIRKINKGVYIDDIFGTDEQECFISVAKDELAKLSCGTGNFLSDMNKRFTTRDSYELFKKMLDENRIVYSENDFC